MARRKIRVTFDKKAAYHNGDAAAIISVNDMPIGYVNNNNAIIIRANDEKSSNGWKLAKVRQDFDTYEQAINYCIACKEKICSFLYEELRDKILGVCKNG